MGELFENLEPMDIQAERRNTAIERERAEKERERAEKAEAQLILNYIDMCLEFEVSQEEILSRLTAKFEMSRQKAEDWFQKVMPRNI
ncbi:MAG: hypothetical protein IJX63_14960 [Lachnospiraceae bacterium]|nr:hypothetical protein [Lachnospiraceae bacterium]